jgi:hypothetical protein
VPEDEYQSESPPAHMIRYSPPQRNINSSSFEDMKNKERKRYFKKESKQYSK